MIYKNVFEALSKAKVKYVVAGGVAVVLHGYRRFTDDLDVIVFMEKKNLNSFFNALKSVGFIPKVPVTKHQFLDPRQREK